MIHELKIEKPFADAIVDGDKNFEIRVNDKGFQKGDLINFTCVDRYCSIPHQINEETYEITYVLSGWGLEKGFVAFGIKLKE